MNLLGYFLFVISIFHLLNDSVQARTNRLKQILKNKKFSLNEHQDAVMDLINRVVGQYHSVNDFVVVLNPNLNTKDLDTFELKMIKNNRKLQITANSPIAAAWGFNYYLKYYTNSSVFWSGKNINLNSENLPIVPNKVKVTAKDYIRFYQNICTYSYSYVWWEWNRWEYEIDWMALNGINMVYAHTAAEYPWIQVLSDLGFTNQEIDNFFAGPAYLAWFRMGNLKRFGGPLPKSWHADQLDLQLSILKRYDELGIKYVLPAFAGFVPDQITRLYPDRNFTAAADWVGFKCNFSCLLMVDPLDPLFKQIGNAYNREVVKLFGTSSLFSADVFNEMPPKSEDLNYLAVVNEAVFNSIQTVDDNSVWVMQGWVFNDPFWNATKVEAFLSRIPIGRLLILDLYSETIPHFNEFSSYFGHNFVWNLLHDFGGANGLFGDIEKINTGPDNGRSFPNSSMIGIGITMEGIDQNEMMYDFMLEKAWRSTLSKKEFADWILNYSMRRYTNKKSASVDVNLRSIWIRIINVLYRTDDYQNKQLFTKRPNFDLHPENISNMDQFFNAWDDMVAEASNYKQSRLFVYDLIDVSKEALRYIFNDKYLEFKDAWSNSNLYKMSEKGYELIDILNDLEEMLSSDEHFLLANWLDDAKSKGINNDERNLYEFNARSQLTLWGFNSTREVFDYACKAWAGLVADYYIPRWNIFIKASQEALISGRALNLEELNERLLVEAELPFIFSKKVYSNKPTGNAVEIVKRIHQKYRL